MTKQNYAAWIDSFVLNIFTADFFEDISNDVKDGFIHLTMMRIIKDQFK